MKKKNIIYTSLIIIFSIICGIITKDYILGTLTLIMQVLGKHIIIYLEHYFVYLMGIYHILMDCME